MSFRHTLVTSLKRLFSKELNTLENPHRPFSLPCFRSHSMKFLSPFSLRIVLYLDTGRSCSLNNEHKRKNALSLTFLGPH